MKELTGQQFLLELLKISGMTQAQLAKKIGMTQGALSNSIKKGNPNFSMVTNIFKQLYLNNEHQVQVAIECAGVFFPAYTYSYKSIIETLEHNQSHKETAEKMKIKPSTLRSRLSRDSCTLYEFKKHLEALNIEPIFCIKNDKLKLI